MIQNVQAEFITFSLQLQHRQEAQDALMNLSFDW